MAGGRISGAVNYIGLYEQKSYPPYGPMILNLTSPFYIVRSLYGQIVGPEQGNACVYGPAVSFFGLMVVCRSVCEAKV